MFFFGGGEKREIMFLCVFMCSFAKAPFRIGGLGGAWERTVVQHMGLKIVSSSGYSVFRCVPFLIKMALGGSVGRKSTKKSVPTSVMTQKRAITRAESISSFSPPGETMSAFFRPKTNTKK